MNSLTHAPWSRGARAILPLVLGSAILILAAVGCATAPQNANIPRLCQVAEGIWCGGQPRDAAAWRYLHDTLGLTNSIKLDCDWEGSDELSEMTVRHFRITPWQEIFGPVGPQVEAAAFHLRPGTFVHCRDGANRVRTVIIVYRVRRCGWDLDKAVDEARYYGWGSSLPALKRFVKTL